MSLFALAAGCGAGEGRTAIDPPDDSVPSSSDDPPPSNEDRPRTNGDQPPPNADQPSRTPDQPGGDGEGGGMLEQLCETVCGTVEQCSDTELGRRLGLACSLGCQAAEGGTAANDPCQRQFVDLLDCAFDAARGECPTEANQAALAQQCSSATEAYASCLQQDDDDDNPDPGEGNCSPAGGCENCGSQCLTCFCEANGNVDDAAACTMLDDCPTVMP